MTSMIRISGDTFQGLAGIREKQGVVVRSFVRHDKLIGGSSPLSPDSGFARSVESDVP